MTQIIKEKIITAYEKLAVAHNAIKNPKSRNNYYDRPNTLELITDVNDKWVLDAACGPGKYAEILLDKGAKLIGFDISARIVELAKIRNKGSGHFFVHDLSNPLDMFESNSFDIVVCTLALHYVEDWNATLKEFHRVLKPKGQLIISVEHPFYEYNYFESKQYFNIESIKAVWKGFGKPIEINSFRRPLQECINPITNNGFYIDQLVEPEPSKEFKVLDYESLEELNAFPAFLSISAVKK